MGGPSTAEDSTAEDGTADDSTADDDRFRHFVRAQDGVYDDVLAELRAGRKTSHWMWFVFPQLAGLGHSETARRFALASLTEARAYLAHPVLGPRLRECTALANRTPTSDAVLVFGPVDAMKLRSSMTLFARADEAGGEFAEALAKFFGGREDPRTVSLLGEG